MTGFFEMIPPDWQNALAVEKDAHYLARLAAFLKEEQESKATVFPPRTEIFNALHLTPIAKTRVVILGQDPYHGAGQAHGLAFSVRKGVRIPPSLRNIYKEIESEYGAKMPQDSDLTNWARQGVLLLNTTLTVRESQAASHQKKGWEDLTDAIIRAINHEREHVVFLLWGSHAQKKADLIDKTRHCILEAPHPSPLSAHRGFLGCGHFQKANDYLQQNAQNPVDWTAL